jgi:hypothetical protein
MCALDVLKPSAFDWAIAAGAALPGTFIPEVYRAAMRDHISGGVDLVLDYRDGIAGAARPVNLRWVQTVIVISGVLLNFAVMACREDSWLLDSAGHPA